MWATGAFRTAKRLQLFLYDLGVLDHGDPAALGRFVARAAGQPDADADRADLGHPLGENTESVIENVSNDW